MLETATDPSKQILWKSLRWARLGALVLLGTLLLGGSARAATAEAPEAPAAEEPQEAPMSGEATPSATEQAQPPAEEVPPAEEAPAGEATPPATEPPPPATEPPPPATEPPIVEAPPPPVEEAQPVLEVIVPAEVPPVVLMPEEGREQASGVSAEEAGGGSSSGSGVTATLASSEEAPPPPSSEGLAATSGSALPLRPADAVQAPSAAEAETVGKPAHVSPFGGAVDLGCELSGLGGPPTKNCAVGWLGTSAMLSTPAAGLAVVGPPPLSTTAIGAAHAIGVQGGTAIDNHPLSPPAGGSAPSGAAGGGSGAGGSGMGLSAFFTLAGLLLLAKPHAMRRLRLSCLPWRTAFFVLIPERPG